MGTLKKTKSKKQQGRVRNLKPVKEVKGSGKIEHAVEHHDTAVTENQKELKGVRKKSHKLSRSPPRIS